MTIRTLFILALMSSSALAQSDIRYYVRDDIKSDKLDYTVDRDCVVFSWGAERGELPELQYHESIVVYGCIQNSFTYEKQDYQHSMSFKEYNELNAIVKKANLFKLGFAGGSSCQFGSLVINGQDHDFRAPLGNPERDKLQSSILAFLDRVAPRKDRQVVTHTIESDLAPAHDVTIHDLLASPKAYDGKRVRVTAYYSSGDGGSNFSQNKGDDTKQSFWLNDASVFAKSADIRWIDHGHATVEGTFSNEPGGDWDSWPGEIQRLTRFIPLDPPEPPGEPKPFTAQSTKHSSFGSGKLLTPLANRISN